MDFSTAPSNTDDGYEESLDSSEPSCSARPNRFRGPDSTWRKLTEEERLVSTSMTRLRDQDLSVHLYNAHAMKRRHYDAKSASKLKPWARKDRWGSKRDSEGDEESATFLPPKAWTAWPLSAHIVPRTGEQIGSGDDTDIWTLKKREVQWPSRELEEILMGITLRIAKERFEAREWEAPLGQHGIAAEKERNERDGESDERIDGDTAMTHSEQEQKTSPIDIRGLTKDIGQGVDSAQEHFVPVGESIVITTAPSEVGQGQLRKPIEAENGTALKQPSESLNSEKSTIPRPTVSADDERSRKLLRPTMRHALSRLDELLMALHHARQTCLYYSSDRAGSQTEADAGDESLDDEGYSSPSPRPLQAEKLSRRGRPLKKLHIPASETTVLGSTEPDKKSNRGRKRKIHVPLEGETEHEMLIRIARLQKKPLPFSSSVPSGYKSSSSNKQNRNGSKKRGSSSYAREKRSARLGLRDWSEVLGTASLVGFPPTVIERATQRCANLFGEGMAMRSLVENPLPGKDGDQITQYFPEQVPAMNDPDDSSMTESEGNEQRPSAGVRKPARRQALNESFWCPQVDCVRHEQGFAEKRQLSRHLKRVHKLQADVLEGALELDSEKMEGGVHVDGFLREVKRRKGWRGSDSEQRQRQRKRTGVTRTVELGEEAEEEFRESDRDDDSDGNGSNLDAPE